MRIGIISDTHDNVAHIIAATERFLEEEVDLVIHCGDIVAPASIKFFKGLDIRFIKGNCDGDVEHIRMKAEEIGCQYLGEDADIQLDGKRFGLYHGTDRAKLQRMIDSGGFDYILTGHTHQKRDERVGKTRVINPGAHYWRAEGTIAILDIEKDEINFLTVGGEE